MVDDKDKLVLQPGDAGFFQRRPGGGEKLIGLVDDELVFYIVFIFKIQVKGSLGNRRFFHDIGDGGGVDAFCGEQFVGGVKKRLFFLFFIFMLYQIYFF